MMLNDTAMIIKTVYTVERFVIRLTRKLVRIQTLGGTLDILLAVIRGANNTFI